MSSRHYRTRRNRIFVYPFAIVGVSLCLLLALVPRGGLAVHAGAVVGIVLLSWLARNAARAGVAMDPSGVRVYGPFRSERVDWDDIVGLDTHRWSINHVVDLRLADGRTLNTNLIQGASVDWDGGETTDILSILRVELRSRGAGAGTVSLKTEQ